MYVDGHIDRMLPPRLASGAGAAPRLRRREGGGAEASGRGRAGASGGSRGIRGLLGGRAARLLTGCGRGVQIADSGLRVEG